MPDRFAPPDFALAGARIECHSFIHDSFLEPNQLLRDVRKIRHLPGVIVQGRDDIVCPTGLAWELHCAWPEAELHIVPDAWHSAAEVGTLPSLSRRLTPAAIAGNDDDKAGRRPALYLY